MTTAPKVLFLGLDAASKDLILRWSEQGLLPTFRSLRENSFWGTTTNAPGLYTGSVWPSLWTGVTAGRHGCYYYEQLKPGTYEIEEFLGDQIKREPFWNVLGAAGRRVALFDVPKVGLSKELNGIQIADWGTHEVDMDACSWPPDLIGEIHERHGASPFRRCDWVMDGPDPELTLRDMLLKRIQQKVAITEDLLGREPWDLFMTVFSDSHCAGHQCWHVHDSSHPRHDPALAATLGDPIRDVYVALDAAVARLLRAAGPETTVIVLLSHGMSVHNDATYLLDDILRRLEGSAPPVTRFLLDRARRAWKKLPVSFTERFRTMARSVNQLPDASDRSRRRCFAVPTNANCAGIRLNVVGREPAGLLRFGEESDEFCRQLTTDLYDLVDPVSGRPLVREVLRSRDIFFGEYAGDLPDLLVRWHRDWPIAGAASPKIGKIVREDTTTRRTGDHRPEGLFFMVGPGIPPGTCADPVHTEDFAPTMAALLDTDLPDVDGRVLIAPSVERR
jgi:predicted AlkP superfamily phosphohydrolase/phosphomutase